MSEGVLKYFKISMIFFKYPKGKYFIMHPYAVTIHRFDDDMSSGFSFKPRL